jgi:putative ABC transport system ATP-binding protein
MQLLRSLHEQGMTIIVVTHESGVAYQAEKIVHIKDGQIESIEVNDGSAHTPFGVNGVMK